MERTVPTHRAARWDQVVSPPEGGIQKVLRLAAGGKTTSKAVAGGIAAACAFAGTLVVMVALAPPMARRRSKNAYDAPGLSVAAVLVWALVAAAAAALLAVLV